MFAPTDFLDLAQTEHAALFEGLEQVWQALPKIALYLKEHVPSKISNASADLKQVLIGTARASRRQRPF